MDSNNLTFKQQGETWLESLRLRRRDPVKPATIQTYKSYLARWIVPNIGDLVIVNFGNSRMKTFVSGLLDAKKGDNPALGPKSVCEIVATVKQIVASAQNEEGIPLFPRHWNNDYVDLPRVDKSSQRAPCATRAEIERAIRQSNSLYQAFYALLAGTGLRIGEARAVRYGDDGVHTSWDPENRLILVRTQFWQMQEIAPKTKAGVRQVDIPEKLNKYLKDYAEGRAAGALLFAPEGSEKPIHMVTLQDALRSIKIPGFHSFRRYRVTYLRERAVPEDIIRYWVGHVGQGITDQYSKLAQNVELRKHTVERVGLGFELPRRQNEGSIVRPAMRNAQRETVHDVPSPGPEGPGSVIAGAAADSGLGA